MDQPLEKPPREASTKEKKAFWKKVIAYCKRSNLKDADFCREHDIEPQQYWSWKSKLKIEGELLSENPDFIPITIDESLSAEQTPTPSVECDGVVQIQTANGHSLLVPANYNHEALLSLIDKLGTLAC